MKGHVIPLKGQFTTKICDPNIMKIHCVFITFGSRVSHIIKGSRQRKGHIYSSSQIISYSN